MNVFRFLMALVLSAQAVLALGPGFPLIGKPSYPSYTSDMIQDVFDSHSASLKLSEVDPLYKIIEMLTQVRKRVNCGNPLLLINQHTVDNLGNPYG